MESGTAPTKVLMLAEERERGVKHEIEQRRGNQPLSARRRPLPEVGCAVRRPRRWFCRGTRWWLRGCRRQPPHAQGRWRRAVGKINRDGGLPRDRGGASRGWCCSRRCEGRARWRREGVGAREEERADAAVGFGAREVGCVLSSRETPGRAGFRWPMDKMRVLPWTNGRPRSRHISSI
jgi:hypothetical protein